MQFDVFNGDADGLCALQQLRLAQPGDGQLVTGVKRDISLLKRVAAEAGDAVLVLDVSLDKNRDALQGLLDKGIKVRYFDHHFAGDIPDHENLEAHIDLSADTCTSLIVNRYLEERHLLWAVVGAFGDNFDNSARAAAAKLQLSEAELMRLRDLGIYLNYNGYGATPEDLYFKPDELAQRMRPYESPFDFINQEPQLFATLRDGASDDLARARDTRPEVEDDKIAVYLFPAEPWARRVAGVYGNTLATEAPDRAHALLTALPEGGYVVSVRAPLNNKTRADELCRSFPTGGGRKAAAGINQLPESMLDKFVQDFKVIYS